MLKRTFEFENILTGEPVKEDWYFHLNKAEVIKWITPNSDVALDKLLEKLMKEERGKDIFEIFDNLIMESVGQPSENGKRFVKNDELREDFKNSEAYSQLFTEVISDAEKAADFVNKIIPSDFSAEFEKILKDNPEGIPVELRDYLPKKK